MAYKLFYASSYDRGLEYLLFMWPDIREKYPDAELHVCYGWQTFDALNRNNPERMAWKERMEFLLEQDGIVHHGRLGKSELSKVRKSCQVWAYPTDFTEINCITALECQRDGVVPVTMDYAALSETVGSGIRVKGDITDVSVQKEYLRELLGLLDDPERLKVESERGKEFAKEYAWSTISGKWADVFREPVKDVSVSVITVTIREGFWNVMADNLSRQTHKGFEWVIVDDHKKDRAKIAQKYAKKYGLDITYVRGDKALGTYKRKYGLVRANNIGWQKAKGELLVFVQDFILIPENGIERLVDVYRHNPDALIAPVDVKCIADEPDKANPEDWWNGDTNISLQEYWRNVRVQFAGIRETSNPFDFEMNYAAIPRAIVEKLNGWWEFFDDAIGFDNTEIASRALRMGYRIIIDDVNICRAIDLGEGSHDLDDSMWERFVRGDLPFVRDVSIDEQTHVHEGHINSGRRGDEVA